MIYQFENDPENNPQLSELQYFNIDKYQIKQKAKSLFSTFFTTHQAHPRSNRHSNSMINVNMVVTYIVHNLIQSFSNFEHSMSKWWTVRKQRNVSVTIPKTLWIIMVQTIRINLVIYHLGPEMQKVSFQQQHNSCSQHSDKAFSFHHWPIQV